MPSRARVIVSVTTHESAIIMPIRLWNVVAGSDSAPESPLIDAAAASMQSPLAAQLIRSPPPDGDHEIDIAAARDDVAGGVAIVNLRGSVTIESGAPASTVRCRSTMNWASS